MMLHPEGAIAVIFMAKRTADHEAEYATAASKMSDLAQEQPGYLGEDHARSEDGTGITISYWSDDKSAKQPLAVFVVAHALRVPLDTEQEPIRAGTPPASCRELMNARYK